VKRLHELNEKKTALIEDLHEKLAKYGEQNSVLLESLQETTTSEKTLRDSLTKYGILRYLSQIRLCFIYTLGIISNSYCIFCQFVLQ